MRTKQFVDTAEIISKVRTELGALWNPEITSYLELGNGDLRLYEKLNEKSLKLHSNCVFGSFFSHL